MAEKISLINKTTFEKKRIEGEKKKSEKEEKKALNEEIKL